MSDSLSVSDPRSFSVSVCPCFAAPRCLCPSLRSSPSSTSGPHSVPGSPCSRLRPHRLVLQSVSESSLPFRPPPTLLFFTSLSLFVSPSAVVCLPSPSPYLLPPSGLSVSHLRSRAAPIAALVPRRVGHLGLDRGQVTRRSQKVGGGRRYGVSKREGRPRTGPRTSRFQSTHLSGLGGPSVESKGGRVVRGSCSKRILL